MTAALMLRAMVLLTLVNIVAKMPLMAILVTMLLTSNMMTYNRQNLVAAINWRASDVS